MDGVDLSQADTRLRFFETVLALGGELTLLVDEAWTITFAHGGAEEVTGYTVDELVGMSALDIVHPDDLGIAAAGVASAESFDPTRGAADPFGRPAHFRLVGKDGRPTMVAAATSNLRCHPDIRGVAVRLRLANARSYLDQFLEALMGGETAAATFEKLAMAVCDDIPDSRLAIAFDWDGQRYRTVLSYDMPEPLAGLIDTAHDLSPLSLAVGDAVVVTPVDGLPPAWRAAANAAGARFCWFQTVERSDDDQRRATMVLWRWTDARPEVNHGLDLQRYANFARLALDRWARDSQLRDAADRDALTGLRNRAGFYGHLEAHVADADASPVCVLFVDLDGFKDVNDRYGHGAGDEILQVVSRRMESEVRPTDVVARLGGDEFAIIARDVDSAAAAEAVAARLLLRFQEPIALGDIHVTVGGSIGGSVTMPDEPADAVVERADRAMYAAKRAGRNRFRLDPTGLGRPVGAGTVNDHPARPPRRSSRRIARTQR